MRKVFGVGLVLAALVLGLFTSASAHSKSSYVKPIRWGQLDNGLPADALSKTNRDVLLNATRYTLGTWYPATYGSQTGRYLDLGGDAEGNIRPPASAVMSLAVTLGTKAYNADRVGVPVKQARKTAVRLLTSIAYHHVVNQAEGGWGDHWQSAFWTADTATAAWLLWDHLGPADRQMVERMVVHEADRFLSYEVPYYQRPDGSVAYPGDTKAEENAWNSTLLNLASAMLPEHPNQPTWQQKALELMVSSYSRPSDLANGTMLNGKPVSEWLNGSNIFEDGTLVNHSIVHPDYMTSITQMTSAPLVYSLAGKATPRAALFNADLVYGALVDLEFATPPYDEPGGTIFRRDDAGNATSDIYYPQGNDWGTHRRMHFALIDTEAELFGFGDGASVPAADWAKAHLDMVFGMQGRFTDGRTYGDVSEDTYSGREQWVAQIAGRAYLARWLDHQGAVRFTNADYPDGSPTPGDVELGPLETASSAVDHTNVAGWWSPMAEYDGDAYVAFNYDYLPNQNEHEVWIARRDGANEFGVRGCLPASGGGCARFPDDPGHNQPSIAVDGDGYIHVFASMHNNGWRYFRSARPADPTEFVNASGELPDQELGFTYPNLTTGPDGDVWLVIRARSVLTRAGARLYHWNNADDTWSLVAGTAFAYQRDPERTVYPDDVDVTSDGDVHIAFEWAHTATGVRHEGSYLRYSPSTDTFHTADGGQVDVPVTPSTSGLVYQPMEPGEAYGGDEGVQSAKLAMSGAPTIAYRYNEPSDPGVFKVKRATFENGQWTRETVHAGPAQTSAAIDVTDDGQTERIFYATAGDGGTAYVAERPSNGGEWTHAEIADGKPVERLAVLTDADGTDWAYLVAPTAISERRGELYFRTVGR